MKLPLSWLKDFLTIEADCDELSRRLTVAGLNVEGIERLRPTFNGVVVAKVLKVERHPNADRLSLCEVDIGSQDKLSVVCGAPNVKAGMTVGLARVGARLAAAEKEPPRDPDGSIRFQDVAPLQAATIRGVRSEGMLCSERELGLSGEHGGIMALGGEAELGRELADYLQLDDTVLDVEITPNRGDCLSVLGLARELAALFALKLKLPRPKPLKPVAADGAVRIEILAPELCPRYAGLPMTRVKIGPSPYWLQRRLQLCGMRSVNNVVDVTNYVMLELGQPLHAFDLAKIGGSKIIVRAAGGDREFTTLDNAARELKPADLVIADAARPIALAGVMGGLESEVSDATSEILLESAYFDSMTIARTARRLGLRSESSYRFERGIDRAGQVVAVLRAAELINRLAGGRPTSDVLDVEARVMPSREIELELARMEALLGARFDPAEVKRRLISIGAKVSNAGKGRFKVTAPSFRPDINEPADLAEEVARLDGLAEIPAALPMRPAARAVDDPRRALIARTRELMIGAGLTEARTIAFTAPADNRIFVGVGSGRSVEVLNPLSAELSELRNSLLPGLLKALSFNLNREADRFHAFELNKVFQLVEEKPAEGQRLSAVSYGEYALAEVGRAGLAAGFFTLKGILESFFCALGVGEQIEFSRAEATAAPYLHPGKAASIMLGGKLLGYLGELHPQPAIRLELTKPCAIFELDFDYLVTYGSPRKAIVPPPRFPAVRRDLALVIDADFPARTVIQTVREIEAPLLESVELFDAYVGEPIPSGKKSVALALCYRALDRTLTDEEVNRAHAIVTATALARLNAEMRQ